MNLDLRAGLLSACLTLFFAMTLAGCHKDAASPATSHPLDLPANSAAVINASNTFGLRFLQTVLRLDPDNNNKLISPLSLYTALSMTYNGASGSTRDSMAKTLSLTGISIDQLNTVSQALIEQMPKEDSKVQLSIANSLWYDQHRAAPLPGFLDTIDRSYQAVMQSLNFSDPASVKTINSWVAQHTNNKIPTVLDGIDPSALMFLINAVYFNGSWKAAFKTSDTRNDIFHLPDGSTASVPFMNQTITSRYYSNDQFKMIELPYGTGKSFSMYLIQPNSSQSLSEFAASLDPAALSTAFSGLDSFTVGISLPKWEYHYGIDNMIPNLTQMGMGIAFSDNADFTNMYPPSARAYLSKALHKTYIKVSEEGTEAAAVTVIGVSQLSIGPAVPLIKFDHPFVYLITEKQTGAILFIGLLNDPR